MLRAILILLLSASAHAATMANYPLTANGNDTSGNGYNLSTTGSLTYGTVAGQTCVRGFAAQTNFLNFPAGLTTALAGLTSFTISADLEYSSGSGYWESFLFSSGTVEGGIWFSSGSSSNFKWGGCVSGSNFIPADGAWHSVMIVQSAGAVSSWLDGTQTIICGSGATAFKSSPSSACLGVYSPGQPNFSWTGAIKNVVIYDTALTPSPVPTATPTFSLTYTSTPSKTITNGSTPTFTVSPTSSPTFSISPTRTITPWLTPTAPATPVSCGVSSLPVFTVLTTPVLVPDNSNATTLKDGFWIGETFLIKGVDNLLHMTYSGITASGLQQVFLATSPTGLPGTFTKHGPVMGNGYGGSPVGLGARVGSQTIVGGTYYMTFQASDLRIHWATSADGYTWAYQGLYEDYFILRDAGICPVGAGSGWDSLAFLYDTSLGHYWGLLNQPNDGFSCVAYGGAAYVQWLLTSPDASAGSWKPPYPVPLNSITSSAGLAGQLYCIRQATKIGNVWNSWPFIGYPSTKIYHSQSLDMQNWKTDPTPLLFPTPGMYGLAACDQVVDPFVIEVNHQTYMYFGAGDNTNSRGMVGLAIYPGPLNLYGCYQPASNLYLKNGPYLKTHMRGR